jgi:hypothetical protein
MNPTDTEETEPIAPPRTVSGRLVVISMFILGIIGGSICVSYAIWHNAPFIELKKALAAEFPQSVPQVEGGQRKGSPMRLRIVVNVDFHPGEEANAVLADAATKRIVELAQQHQDLSPYETLRVHLVKVRPQDTTSRSTVDIRVADLPGRSP